MRLLRIKLSRWKVGELYFLLYCLFFMANIVLTNTLPDSNENSSCPSLCTCVKSTGLVNCSNKGLRELPEDIPTWVRQLVLRNNRLTAHGLYRFNFSIFEQLEELDLSENKLQNLTVDLTGTYSLRKISLNHCSLASFPNIKLMSNITQLLLSHNSMSDLGNAFKSFPTLVLLDLSFNKIRQIKPDTFLHLNQLKNLYLQKNRVSTLSWNTFAGLDSIEVLDLSRNKIRNFAKPAVPQPANKQDICSGHLQTLKYLNMSQNQISHIDGLTFAGMCSLVSVRLERNRINKLSDGAFYGPIALKTLILDHNYISSVAKGWLFKLSSLQTLSVAYNNLSKIEPDGWDFCEELVHLNLSHNRLTSLSSHGFSRLGKLETLEISFNRITLLKDFAFDGLGLLRTLDLSHNEVSSSIEDIDGAFLELSSIEYLSLRRNRIRSLSSSALEGLENVVTLDLCENDVTSIQNHTFEKMSKLKTLSIISSSFLCDCQLAWFPKWLNFIKNTRDDFAYTVKGSCFHPPALKGRDILSIESDEFVCVDHPIPILLQEPTARTALIGDNITLECSASATYTDMENETVIISTTVTTTTVGISSTEEGNSLPKSGDFQPMPAEALASFGDEGNPSVLGDSQTKTGESRSRSGAFPLKADEPPKEEKKKRTPPQRRDAEKRFNFDRNGMTVTWKRGQNIIQPGAGIEIRNITRQQGGYVFVTSLLVLTGVTSEDNGKYNCIISNSYGHARSKPVELIVNEYPRFTKMPVNVTVVTNGSSAILDCAATGQPSPQIQWKKDGGKTFPAATQRRLLRQQKNQRKHLLAEEETDVSRNIGVMLLKPGLIGTTDTEENKNEKFAVDSDAPLEFGIVLPEDEGEYECVVESSVGKVVAKAMLIVEMPPYFPKPMPTEANTVTGGNAVIQCLVEGEPSPEILWQFNGKPMNLTSRIYVAAKGRMVIITDAQKNDAGIYTCFVSNKHGTLQSATQLVVSNDDTDGNIFTRLFGSSDGTWIMLFLLVAVIISTLLTSFVCHCVYKKKKQEKAPSTNTDETDFPDGHSYSSTDESVRKCHSSHSIHTTEDETNAVQGARLLNRQHFQPYRGSASMSDISHMQIIQSRSPQTAFSKCQGSFSDATKLLPKHNQSSMTVKGPTVPSISRFRSAESFRMEDRNMLFPQTEGTGEAKEGKRPKTPIASPSSYFAKKAAGEDNYIPVQLLKLKKPQVQGGSQKTAPSSVKTPHESQSKSKRLKKVKGRNHGQQQFHKKEQNHRKTDSSNHKGKVPVITSNGVGIRENGRISQPHCNGKVGVAGLHPLTEQNNTQLPQYIRQSDKKDNFAKTRNHELAKKQNNESWRTFPHKDRRKSGTESSSFSETTPPEGSMDSGDSSHRLLRNNSESQPKISNASSGVAEYSSRTTLTSESSLLLHQNHSSIHNTPAPPSGHESNKLLT